MDVCQAIVGRKLNCSLQPCGGVQRPVVGRMALKKTGHEDFGRQLTLQELTGGHAGLRSLRLRDQSDQIAIDVVAELRTKGAQNFVVADLLVEQFAVVIAKLSL